MFDSSDLSALRLLVFDLDGVVWRGETPVPGAADSIARLRNAGRRCVFATNNSARPPQFFADKLARCGIEASPEDVVTSSTATAFFVAKHHAGARVFLIGEDGVRGALQHAGAHVFGAADAPEAVDVVVVGLDREFSYQKLKIAQRYIRSGARFLATNRDPTFPVEGGVVPGAGSIVASVATASEQEPISMGKPEPTMLQIILEREGIGAEHAAMIGDRLDTDIACGRRAETRTVLITTGVTSRAEGEGASGEQKPDFIFENLELFTSAVLT